MSFYKAIKPGDVRELVPPAPGALSVKEYTLAERCKCLIKFNHKTKWRGQTVNEAYTKWQVLRTKQTFWLDMNGLYVRDPRVKRSR